MTALTTTADLLTALKTAQAGDVLTLAAGDYGRVDATGYKPAGEVVITGAKGARIAFLNVKDCANLTFRGLEIAAPGPGGQGVRITRGQYITLDALDVHGILDGDPTTDGVGALAEDSQGVTIRGCKFHDLCSGIGHARCNGLFILDNSMWTMRADGVAGSDSSNVTIRGNDLRDFYPVLTGASPDHADAFQFWQVAPGGVQENITVTDNVVRRGLGQPIQGLFMTASQGGFKGVTVRGNAFLGCMYHGITVDKTEGAVVTDNLVQGHGDKQSKVSWILVSNSPGAVVTGNRATGYGPSGWDWKAAGNVLVEPLDDAALAGWRARNVPDPRDGQITALTSKLAAARAALA